MKLNDQKARELLSRYIDGELDEQTAQQLENYMADSPLLQLELEQEKKFDLLIRNHVHRTAAPFVLREAVVHQLEEPGRLNFVPGLSWLTNIPRFALVGMVLVILTFSLFFRPQKPFPIFAESVSTHMQFLKGSLPMEIVSSDLKEVTSWLQGKVDFALHIPDLSQSGAQLVGARLCHLKDKKAAYLVFKKDGHQLSLFVMDTEGMVVPDSKSFTDGVRTFYVNHHKGYRSILCLDGRDAGMGCVFVSDLSEEKILELVI